MPYPELQGRAAATDRRDRPGPMSGARRAVLTLCGSGGLKANTTAVLGGVYGDDGAGRESGFALFYLGVNVGSLAGAWRGRRGASTPGSRSPRPAWPAG